MPATQAEQQKFMAYLNKKVPGGVKCPVCQQKATYNADKTGLPTIGSNGQANLNQLYSVAMLQCNNCSHIMLFGNEVFK